MTEKILMTRMTMKYDSNGKILSRFDPDCCSSCPSPVSDYTQPPTPTLPLLCWYIPSIRTPLSTYQSVIQLPLLSSTAPNKTTFTSAPPLAPLVFAIKYVCQVLVISHWAALTLLAHPAGGHDATMLMMTMLLIIPMMMRVMLFIMMATMMIVMLLIMMTTMMIG